MSVFTYSALDKQDSFIRGSLKAKSMKAATAQLEGDGFLIVNVKEEKAVRFAWLNNILNNVTRLDRIFFTRHLHTMIEAGMALDESIKVTSEQVSNQKFRAVLHDITKRIQRGEALHSTLQHHRKFFPPFYINIIKVGEKSGKLDEVLGHLLEQQESDYELIMRARNALTYPIIIVIALVLMVTLMMTFVIPRVTAILTEYDVDLPLATKILIGTSNLFIHYGWLILPVLVGLVVLARRWVKTPRGKWRWDGWLLRLPLVKNIIKEFNLARLTRSLSALLKSGIAFDEAVRLTSTVSNNSRYQASLRDGLKFIRKGVHLTDVLQGSPQLYPPLTTRMVSVGERTGKLDYMLNRLATFYEKSVANTLGNLATVIEPVLLLLVGLVVAFVAISVLTPIWKFSETI